MMHLIDSFFSQMDQNRLRDFCVDSSKVFEIIILFTHVSMFFFISSPRVFKNDKRKNNNNAMTKKKN